MAIRRDVRYGSRWEPSSAGYPGGAAKNRTAPGANNGGYPEKDWINDIFGYLDSLLVGANMTHNQIVDQVGASQYYDALIQLISAHDDVPVGAIMAYTVNTAPTGWLKANGAAISRTTYANLFAVIGTTFGAGDGSTTFNVPDLRGEFIRGWDDGRGVDTGRVFGSAQGFAIQSHTHGAPRGIVDTGNRLLGPETFRQLDVTDASGGAETRPRNVALLYCIKY